MNIIKAPFRMHAGILWLVFFLHCVLFTGKIHAQSINACNNKFEKDSLIVLDRSEELKSVVFNYQKCDLNLSDFTYLGVDIHNKSSAKIIVDVQYFGPHKNHVNQGRYFVDAKTAETAKLILYRTKLKNDSPWYQYFEKVRGLPGGFTTHWNAFDLSEVKKVVVTISSEEPIDGDILIKAPKGIEKLRFDSSSLKNQKFPILDEMGQYVSDTWEGKINDVDTLTKLGLRDIKKYSKAKVSQEFSKYGGWKKGPKKEAKGFFYTTKQDGKWWFVDPEGYLFLSQGVTGVASNSSTSRKNRAVLFTDFEKEKSSPDWIYLKDSYQKNNTNFYELNLKRKYGFNWKEIHEQVTAGRMKSWGLNTYGAWSRPSTIKKHPFTLIIHPKKQGIGKISKMVDPFSEAFKQDLISKIKQLQKYKTDPWLLGVFVNNELHWGNEFTIPNEILKLKNHIPARKAFEKMLKNKYQSIEGLNKAWQSDFESFKSINDTDKSSFTTVFQKDMLSYFKHFTETYFKTTANELKKVLPNHLYFGSRFHGKVKYNKTLHKAASKYCDVISFNIYEYSVKDFKVHTEIDKPAIIGEFHFGTGSHGVWGVGLRSATSVEHQAQLYQQYMYDVIKHPSFIGAHWFQWVDQLATGRGSDGENFRIGIVNITDQPYKPLIEAIQKTSKELYQIRKNN